MEATGIIKEIMPIESGTSKNGKEWKKQAFVLNTNAEYNPDICFSVFGKSLAALEHRQVGESVTVQFNLSSREFNGKWYHNVDAWKIDLIGQPEQPKEEEDDLPY